MLQNLNYMFFAYNTSNSEYEMQLSHVTVNNRVRINVLKLSRNGSNPIFNLNFLIFKKYFLVTVRFRVTFCAGLGLGLVFGNPLITEKNKMILATNNDTSNCLQIINLQHHK